MKVLFICLGNICRSPLAEGLFIKHLSDLNLLEKFTVDSCGTGNWHAGQNADPRTLSNAQKNNITLTHKARQLKKSDFEEFDYLLVMDKQNYADVTSVHPEKSDKVFIITDLTEKFSGQIIPDPYFGGDQEFEQVFDLLNKVTLNVAESIISKHGYK